MRVGLQEAHAWRTWCREMLDVLTTLSFIVLMLCLAAVLVPLGFGWLRRRNQERLRHEATEDCFVLTEEEFR